MSTPATKRPWITANQVTFARLIPMPLLSWCVYQGYRTGEPIWWWTALILGTLIGCTDFIDGYLARKQGPTVLGGLIDPIADKVFIAFAYLPFADLGIVPAWAVALMFVREFVVTALRSAYEQRDLSMKTSYLGKVKTWTQMQGIGVIVLFFLLAEHPRVMTGILVAGVVGPLVAMAALWLARRRFWTGALVMSALIAPLIYLHHHGDLLLTTKVIMFAVVGVTWLSGLDYVVSGFSQLRGRGDFRAADATRLLGAVALPVLVFAALVEAGAPVWAVAAILAVELSVGGLDNLLSHHRAAAAALPWGARTLGTSALLALTLVTSGSVMIALAACAMIASVGGVAWEFWRGREYYLDRRLREKSRRDALAAESA